MLLVFFTVAVANVVPVHAAQYNFSGYGSYEPRLPTGIGLVDEDDVVISNASDIYSFDPSLGSQNHILAGGANIADVAFIEGSVLNSAYDHVAIVTTTGSVILTLYSYDVCPSGCAQTWANLLSKNPVTDTYIVGTVDNTLGTITNANIKVSPDGDIWVNTNSQIIRYDAGNNFAKQTYTVSLGLMADRIVNFNLLANEFRTFSTCWAGACGGNTRINTYNYTYVGANIAGTIVYDHINNGALNPTGIINSNSQHIYFSISNNLVDVRRWDVSTSITVDSSLYYAVTDFELQGSSLLILNNLNVTTIASESYYNPGWASNSLLDYLAKNVESVYDNYYQNQEFDILTYVRITNAEFENVDQNYVYYIDLLDPKNAKVGQYPFYLSFNYDNQLICVITLSCDWGYQGTIQFSPISNWTNGTYTVQLIEKNISSSTIAVLDSDTFQVYLGNVSGSLPGQEDISQSPTVKIIDGWTAMFNLGTNSVSKFLFAVIWIVAVTLTGYWATKNGFAGIAAGFVPFAFFTYIGYVPYWFIVVFVIVLAGALRIFR